MPEFSDAPCSFFEAQPSAPMIRLGRQLNRHLILPGTNHRIREITATGDLDALEEARGGENRLMFVINHPSHSDARVLAEIHRHSRCHSSWLKRCLFRRSLGLVCDSC